MLSRSHRLTRSVDIQAVIKTGQRFRIPHIQISALPGQAANTRIACIAGKKVDKLAVKRHKYQRWLREFARELLPQLTTKLDIVFVGQPSLQKITSFQELKDSLSPLAKQLNNIN